MLASPARRRRRAAYAGRGRADAIRVGSKNFTEQIMLGEIVAQTIETRHAVARRAPAEPRRHVHLRSRACARATSTLYVEYSGTAQTAIFHQPPDTDPRRVFDASSSAYADAGLTLLDPLGFENTFAMLVRGDDAAAAGLAHAFRRRAARLGVAGRVRLRVPSARRRISRACPRVRSPLCGAADRDGSVADLPRAGASGRWISSPATRPAA